MKIWCNNDTNHAPTHEPKERRHRLNSPHGAVLLEDPQIFDVSLVFPRSVGHLAAKLTSLLAFEHAVSALNLHITTFLGSHVHANGVEN